MGIALKIAQKSLKIAQIQAIKVLFTDTFLFGKYHYPIWNTYSVRNNKFRLTSLIASMYIR